jgi:tetratricopeptide (TPR) repeat protein
LDFQNAYLNYKKMFETDISDTRIMSEAAFRLGHFDIQKGIEYLKISLEKDPLYSETYNNLAHLYLLDGQYKKSTDLLLARMTMTDGYYPWQVIFINIYGGYIEDAETALSQLLANPYPNMNLEYMTLVSEMFMAAKSKDDLNFEKKLAQVVEIGLQPFSLACALALYGDYDRSFEWLEKGYEIKSVEFFQELKYAPWFKEMRKDPRWPVFLNKLKMPGYENDKIKT